MLFMFTYLACVRSLFHCVSNGTALMHASAAQVAEVGKQQMSLFMM